MNENGKSAAQKKSRLCDIGFNLMNSQFDTDREFLMQEMKKNGVAAIITNTCLSQAMPCIEAIKTVPEMWCTLGCHPHNAHWWNTTEYQNMFQSPLQEKVVAVGECGLDYDRMCSTKKEQLFAFESQVHYSEFFKKPLFLHYRPGKNEDRSCLKEFLSIMDKGNQKAVVHCFTGSRYELDAFLERGYFIGITGWLCDPTRGQNLRSLFNTIPLDRVMIESDAPYLIPKNMAGWKKTKRNSPLFMDYILDTMCELSGIPVEELSSITLKNSEHFFKVHFDRYPEGNKGLKI